MLYPTHEFLSIFLVVDNLQNVLMHVLYVHSAPLINTKNGNPVSISFQNNPPFQPFLLVADITIHPTAQAHHHPNKQPHPQQPPNKAMKKAKTMLHTSTLPNILSLPLYIRSPKKKIKDM